MKKLYDSMNKGLSQCATPDDNNGCWFWKTLNKKRHQL